MEFSCSFPPSCLYMLGMCVVWLGNKMGDWLVLSVFGVLCCRKNVSFIRWWSLHCTHKNWGQIQVQEPEHPATKQRQRSCQKVTFAKEKEKNVGGWGSRRGMSCGMKTQMHQSSYLQTNRKYKHYIWNQVKTPGGAKFRYCLGSKYIFQQNKSSLKNKQSIVQVNYWLVF